MRMRYLGRTGLQVSEICLGVMTFGGSKDWDHVGALNQEEADQFVRTAFDSGVNFFDTADIYSYGLSEEMLGKALGNRRKDAVIATKVAFNMKKGANSNGASRHRIISGCEESLRRLGSDYIDLYQIHCHDPATPIDEALRALDDLVRQGKVRYIGCSNYTGWQLMKALATSDKLGLERFATLQAYYNLAARDLEYELVPLCVEEGLGILPWSPLAGGFLTGKFRRGQERPKGTRLEKREDQLPFDEDAAYDAVEEMDRIARERGVSIPQVALNYLLQKPGVTSVVIGARTHEQLKDNLHAAEWDLSAEEVGLLDKITTPRPVYPYWFINSAREDRRRPPR